MCTNPPCSKKVWTHSLLCLSHNFTVLSSLPETIKRPSGENLQRRLCVNHMSSFEMLLKRLSDMLRANSRNSRKLTSHTGPNSCAASKKTRTFVCAPSKPEVKRKFPVCHTDRVDLPDETRQRGTHNLHTKQVDSRFTSCQSETTCQKPFNFVEIYASPRKSAPCWLSAPCWFVPEDYLLFSPSLSCRRMLCRATAHPARNLHFELWLCAL